MPSTHTMFLIPVVVPSGWRVVAGEERVLGEGPTAAHP